MANLTTSNLLWYIYQRNCEVGYPTVISMSQFRAEFPAATRKDIVQELDNLINGMHFIHRRFLCVYDLTYDGLDEVLLLQNFVVNNPCERVWWVPVLQIIVRWIFRPIKVSALILVACSMPLSLYAGETNEVVVSIGGNVNCQIDANHQMEVLDKRISAVADMVNRQGETIEKETGRLSEKLSDELVRKIGVVTNKCATEYDKRYENLQSQYETAYKNLRDDYDKFTDRLGNWLTVIGIFVALLGICVPVVATFLQWKNVKAGITALEQGKEKELSKLRRDSVRSLHMSLLQGVQSVDLGVKLSTLDMTTIMCSIIICFDDLLECAMRTNDENVVKDEVAAFRPFIDRWSNSKEPERINIWGKCVTLLKSAMKNRKNLSRRRAFVELLDENSETFKWLEGFYQKFAEWKFA